MIRKNLINCKLFHEKRSGNIIFSESVEHLRTHGAVCPHCGNSSFHIHGYYERTVIDFVNNKPVKTVLCICRLICSFCRNPSATHALLPDPIIPYCRHSLRFILRVLAEHTFRLRSVERICEAFDISVRTFYRWQKLLEEHRKEWQGLLYASGMDLRTALLDLLRQSPFSSFAGSFIQKTGLSLLQSHKNPMPTPPGKDPGPVPLPTT